MKITINNQTTHQIEEWLNLVGYYLKGGLM